jgi:hypothetical protein
MGREWLCLDVYSSKIVWEDSKFENLRLDI